MTRTYTGARPRPTSHYLAELGTGRAYCEVCCWLPTIRRSRLGCKTIALFTGASDIPCRAIRWSGVNRRPFGGPCYLLYLEVGFADAR